MPTTREMMILVTTVRTVHNWNCISLKDDAVGIIFDEIKKLGSETDPNKIKDAKREIGQLIDDRIAKIASYVADAANIATTLLSFENNLTVEQKDLDPRIKAVVSKLSGEGGDIERLNKDIEEIKANITKAQEEVRLVVNMNSGDADVVVSMQDRAGMLRSSRWPKASCPNLTTFSYLRGGGIRSNVAESTYSVDVRVCALDFVGC